MSRGPRQPVDGDIYVEYWPLDRVKATPVNPKDHDLGFIHQSIDRFGFRVPMVLDERTGLLAAGHGRQEALALLQSDGADPPAGIVERKGVWHVPVVRGTKSSNDDEAQAFLVADNRATELGAWDEAVLLPLLEGMGEIRSRAAGFDDADIQALVRSQRDLSGRGVSADTVPEPRATDVEVGDCFRLGLHRVLCGNATSSEHVTRLLDGATPAMTITDPPYGVNYDPNWRRRAYAEGALHGHQPYREQVVGDDVVDWTEAWKLAPGPIMYCWHAGVHAGSVQASLEEARFLIRSQVIWLKATFPISRGHYHWRHEPCWYAVAKGKGAHWIGDRKQNTIWEVSLDATVPGDHSTQKPVELMRRALDNHKGDVYDPFVGTGSTLIAAEQAGRACFAMDLVPMCIQIVIDRWESFTGQTAERLPREPG